MERGKTYIGRVGGKIKDFYGEEGVRLIDNQTVHSYNEFRAEVAQSVEHLTENQGVPSSILGLGTALKMAEVAE